MTDQTPEIPVDVDVKVQLTAIRESNVNKVQQILASAQTDVVAQAAMVRTNMLAEAIFPDEDARAEFELAFEKTMEGVLDFYMSTINRQKLTQNVPDLSQFGK